MTSGTLLGYKPFQESRGSQGFPKKPDLELLVLELLVAAQYLLKCCFPLASQKDCKLLQEEGLVAAEALNTDRPHGPLYSLWHVLVLPRPLHPSLYI